MFQQYQPVFLQHEALEAKSRQLDAKLANLPKLDLNIPPLAAALRLISQQIPEEMALTNMNIQEAERLGGLEVRLRGLILGQKKDAFPLLTSFMEQLEKATIFSEVRLGSAGGGKTGPRGALDFEITCRLK
jgi:hypothetical protein